jgi:hypothetical protein
MNSTFQKGQKVITPEGEGLVEDILDDEITVKLNSGEIKSFSSEQLEDDSDQG